MKKPERIKKISFADKALEKAFEDLQKGKFEEQRLAGFLKRAMDDLKKDPFCGIRIPSDLWPKEYVQKYHINNLRKYDLPDGWRLLYTIRGNDIEIVSVLLEWLRHKEYDRKFNYKRT